VTFGHARFEWELVALGNGILTQEAKSERQKQGRHCIYK